VSGETVLWVTPSGTQRRSVSEIEELRTSTDGFLWLDIAEPDESVADLLADRFHLHARAIAALLERNHVSRVHTSGDELFLALHKPLPGKSGHVHYLELDLYVTPTFLITVHGPRNPVVPLEAMLTETTAVADRLLSGRATPRGPVSLQAQIVSSLTREEETMLNDLARDVGQLEQRVMFQGDTQNPQQFLTELFTLRHALLTIHTMSSQSSEIYTRAEHLLPAWSKEDHKVLQDVRDQYQRLSRISSSQLQFLQGVTEYYRARTDTKMTIAAERLAVIAAVTLPVTAISSIVGMNVIVNDSTHWEWLIALLAMMAALSGVLLVWAKRQGWW
jgi:Mg2+ and Co2+ transporter CorA